jgi:glutathione S-transferase
MGLPNFKLISFPLCPYVQRARITLNEKNIAYDLELIDLEAPPVWFYDISPLEKVPVLLVDNQPLFESMVICEYLDEVTPGSLYPADPFTKAQNRAWIEFGNDILSNTYAFFTTDNEQNFKQIRATLEDRFDILEEQLHSEPYFNGQEFSLVDAVFAPLFRFYEAASKYQTFNFFDDTPKILKWWKAILLRPSVENSVPETYMQDMQAYLLRQDSIFSKNIKPN